MLMKADAIGVWPRPTADEALRYRKFRPVLPSVDWES